MDRAQQMGTKPILSLLTKFAVPSILSLVLHALYNLVDRIFIGQGIGPLGLAGVTFCFPIMLFIFGFCLLFSSGSAALISLYLGQKKHEKAEETLGNTIAILTVMSILITVCGFLFGEDILRFFLVSPEAFPHARDYLKTIVSGSVFFFYGFALTFIIRAEGNPIYATVMMLVATVINIILDPLFIFVFKIGMC